MWQDPELHFSFRMRAYLCTCIEVHENHSHFQVVEQTYGQTSGQINLVLYFHVHLFMRTAPALTQ